MESRLHRKEAAYPLSYLESNKFWPSVTRIDDAFGDRNLICLQSDRRLYRILIYLILLQKQFMSIKISEQGLLFPKI